MTEKMEIRAAFVGTVNPDARTVELVFATGTPVKRYSHEDGYYNEVLTISRDAIDTTRLDTGAVSLLDTHDQYSMDARLGSVVAKSFRVEDGKAICTVKFSRRERADAFFQDIADGLTTPVSVGYRVLESAKSEGQGDALPTITATRWLPLEVSLCPVPADGNSHTRSEGNETMTTETTPQPNDAPQQQYQRPANLIAERKRVKDIRDLGRTSGLEAEADDAIDNGMPVEAFRSQMFNKLVERQNRAPTFPMVETRGVDGQERNVETDARVDALVARMTGKPPEGQARQFMSDTLMDHARGLLEAGGVNTRGMSREQVLGARPRSYGMHTTSDFPMLLQGAGERVLQSAYQAAQSPLKTLLSRASTATDFRAKSTLKISDGGMLEKVNEHGEIKATTRSEAGESYRIESFGRIFSMTFQAIVNDDLNAFGDWNRWAGQMAAATENKVLLDLLLSGAGAGPVMGEDGKRLFHADHGNLAAAGTALDEINLGAAILAFRKQKAMGGHRIAVAPKYLLVGPELELVAQKLVASISPTTTSDAVPDSIKSLTPVVEPNLDGKAWHLFADPSSVPTFEYAHLAGHEGVQLTTEDGFEILGTKFRAVLHFGAGAVDYRGAYRNPGL